MPVNWNELEEYLNNEIEVIAIETDRQLASRVSSLTKMTDSEITKLFPEAVDVRKLAHLMKIVNSAKNRNTKINQIIANAEEFGGVIFTLLKKLV